MESRSGQVHPNACQSFATTPRDGDKYRSKRHVAKSKHRRFWSTTQRDNPRKPLIAARTRKQNVIRNERMHRHGSPETLTSKTGISGVELTSVSKASCPPSYSAMNHSGQKVLGQLNAANRGEALQSLGQQAMIAADAGGESENASWAFASQAVRNRRCLQSSGRSARHRSPAAQALRVMEQQTTSAGLKTALGRIAERVSDGATLADAMTEQSELFGDLEISMVRAGEEGGFLDESLSVVSRRSRTTGRTPRSSDQRAVISRALDSRRSHRRHRDVDVLCPEV